MARRSKTLKGGLEELTELLQAQTMKDDELGELVWSESEIGKMIAAFAVEHLKDREGGTGLASVR